MAENFLVVAFQPGDDIDIVRESYFDASTGMCWWPENERNATKKIMNGAAVDERTWKKYKAEVLATCSSYKNAQKALKLAEIGEDIPSHLTTDDEQMGKRMRKKKRLSALSSAEEDADDGDSDVSIPYPPTVLKHKKSIPEAVNNRPALDNDFIGSNANLETNRSMYLLPDSPIQNSSTAQDLVSSVPQASASPATAAVAERSQSAISAFFDNSSNAAGCHLNTTTPNISASRQILIDTNIITESSEFNRYVCRALEYLKTKSDQNGKGIETLLLRSSPTEIRNITASVEFKLPLNSVDDVQELEKKLMDEGVSNQLISELGRVGGGDLGNVTRKVLRAVLTDQLAMEYSYLGQRGKRSFSALALKKIVIDSVYKNDELKSTKVSAVEEKIADWLKQAKSRHALKERSKKNTEVPSSNEERVEEQ